ncbi:MAG: hypothetical protein HZB83_06770 [Deltaproteobacteria bacterium]|nr:hypothetical protein [Deltaproteobacteria bacterium]
MSAMKRCVWDEEKNNKLRRERGISFEEAAFHIEAGHVQGGKDEGKKDG